MYVHIEYTVEIPKSVFVMLCIGFHSDLAIFLQLVSSYTKNSARASVCLVLGHFESRFYSRSLT